MSHATSTTFWPSTLIPLKTKHLIDHFFSLVDNPAPNAGSRLATEVFTRDGRFFATSGRFEGVAEITNSRNKVWDRVSSRHHQVEKVYANDAEGLDLLVIGSVTVESRSTDGMAGAEECRKSHGFLARMVFEDGVLAADADADADVGPMLKHYEVLVSGRESIL